MKGRSVVVLVLGGLFVVLGLVFWMGVSGGGTAKRHAPDPAQNITETPLQGPVFGGTKPAASASRDGTSDSGVLTRTVTDRKVRDDLRRRILEDWASSGQGEVAAAAKQGKFVPAPTGDGGGMDPKYIQSVIREDFVPMAGKCYEEVLARKPSAKGRLVLDFTIAGDEDVGGIVEEANVAKESTLVDEKMATCMRESLLSMGFRPPAHGGTVTVRYPIELSPGDGGE